MKTKIDESDDICQYHIDLERRLSLLDGKLTVLILINAAAILLAIVLGRG